MRAYQHILGLNMNPFSLDDFDNDPISLEEKQQLNLELFKENQRVIALTLQAITISECSMNKPDLSTLHTCMMALCNSIEAGNKADYLFLDE